MTLLQLAAKIFRAPKASAGKRIAIAGEPPTLSTSATVQSVQGAIRMAEQGETKNLFALYRDITVSGSHVFAELSKRKLAVLAQPHALMPANKTSSEDAAAVAAVTEMIARCDNWLDGLGHLLDATLWPVAVAEKIYGPAGEAMGDAPKLSYWLKRLEPVNPTLLCFKPIPGAAPSGGEEWESDLRLYPVNEQGKVVYSAQDATNLEPDRHLVYRGHLMTGQRDCWGGPMRAIVFWWLLGGLARDWFAGYMQRFGTPFLVGHTDIQNSAQVDLLKEAFSLSTKIGGVVVDTDTQIELMAASAAEGATAHEKFLAICNREISKIILGQTLSADAQATGLGSSVGDLQSNVREDIRAFDQLRLGDVLQRQLFEPFLRINGLTGAPPKIVWGGLSDEDAKLFADLLESLSRSGWEPTDEAADTVQERVGFPVQRKAAPVLPGAFGKGPAPDDEKPDGEPVPSDEEKLAAQSGLNITTFYNPDQPRDEAGRWGEGGAGGGAGAKGKAGGKAESRSERAKRTHVPMNAEKRRIADEQEAKVAKAVGGKNIDDHKPFDVETKTYGIEVKSLQKGGNDKITMHPSSRQRKENEAKARGLKTATVGIDLRGSRPAYYFKAGVGAYRLRSMQRIGSLSELNKLLK